MPVVSVTFSDGTSKCSIGREQGIEHTNVPSLAWVKQGHPLIPARKEATSATSTDEAVGTEIRRMALTYRPERIRRYNEELEVYFREYELYLDQLADWEEKIVLHKEVRLLISNIGTSRASNIDLYLFFPENIKAISKHNVPKKPTPPIEPVLPGTTNPRSLRGIGQLRPQLGDPVDSLVRTNNDGMIIVNCERNFAHIAYSSLKHGFDITSEPVIFRFISKKSVGSFSISYELSADELPEPTNGELHIRVDDM